MDGSTTVEQQFAFGSEYQACVRAGGRHCFLLAFLNIFFRFDFSSSIWFCILAAGITLVLWGSARIYTYIHIYTHRYIYLYICVYIYVYIYVNT